MRVFSLSSPPKFILAHSGEAPASPLFPPPRQGTKLRVSSRRDGCRGVTLWRSARLEPRSRRRSKRPLCRALRAVVACLTIFPEGCSRRVSRSRYNPNLRHYAGPVVHKKPPKEAEKFFYYSLRSTTPPRGARGVV